MSLIDDIMKKSKYGFWGSLVRRNTGVSSLNFYLIGVTIIGIALLALVIFAIAWEVIHNNTVSSDINGWAAFVGAVAGLFATAGITKGWSNWSENKFAPRNYENSLENDSQDSEDIPDKDVSLQSPGDER